MKLTIRILLLICCFFCFNAPGQTNLSFQLINVGTSANSGTGDTLRSGGQKINSNFQSLSNWLAGGFFNGTATIAGNATNDQNGLNIAANYYLSSNPSSFQTASQVIQAVAYGTYNDALNGTNLFGTLTNNTTGTAAKADGFTTNAPLASSSTNGLVWTNDYQVFSGQQHMNSWVKPLIYVDTFMANSSSLPSESWLTNYAAWLNQYGWVTNCGVSAIDIDDGWQGVRDGSGNMPANTTNFPNGMAPVASYIKQQGLMTFLYDDVGQTSISGYTGCYGYESNDVINFKSWGVDGIISDCGNLQNLPISTPIIQYHQYQMYDAMQRYAPNMIKVTYTGGYHDYQGTNWPVYIYKLGNSTITSRQVLFPWMTTISRFNGWFVDPIIGTYGDTGTLYYITNYLNACGYWLNGCTPWVATIGGVNNNSTYQFLVSTLAMFHASMDFDANLYYLTNLNSSLPNNGVSFFQIFNPSMIRVQQDTTSMPRTVWTNGTGAQAILDTLKDGSRSVLVFNNVTNTTQTGSIPISSLGMSGPVVSQDKWLNTISIFSNSIPVNLIGSSGTNFQWLNVFPLVQPKDPMKQGLVFESTLGDSYSQSPLSGLNWVSTSSNSAPTGGEVFWYANAPVVSGPISTAVQITNVANQFAECWITNVGPTSFTVYCDFQATNSTMNGVHLFESLDSTAVHPGFQLLLYSGAPQFNIWDASSSAHTVNTSQTFGDGAWHELGGTWDGTNMVIYYDGVSKNTNTAPSLYSGISFVRLGTTYAGMYYNEAKVGIYNRCLNSNAMNALYMRNIKGY